MKNQSTVGENGIYTVTTASAAGAAIVLTRATDFDVVADMKSGAFVFVQQGTANADSGWVVTQDNTITVGSTDPAFTQFSGAGQITAGDGLTKDGNTLDLTDIATGGVLGNTSGSDAAPARVSTPMIGLITAANAGDARTALGTQAVATGGTGATSLTDGGILLGSGTSAVTAMAALADSEMIVGDGTTDPVAESGDTLRISIGVGSTSTFQCTGIELGHATANTLTASSGIMSIEGVAMPTISSTDTLTNKTITAPVLGGTVTGTYTLGGTPTLGTGTVLTLPQVNDTSSNHQYVFAVSELVADRTVTLPLLTGNDTFVFADFIQTLTNKTLSGGTF